MLPRAYAPLGGERAAGAAVPGPVAPRGDSRKVRVVVACTQPSHMQSASGSVVSVLYGRHGR